ncbi:luciferase domain-containing protein [Streptoalloteichus hindustanus]|uniref:luciferase domain-containing protein n=1 Tax=Streptoalloteichus hindustanus TaxID=2017 RepID=UPI001F313E97|nr:luciferase family protein [Streptoalloteichus hindustanus]
MRAGERPRTGPRVPHVQLTQTSPPALREELTRGMARAFPRTTTGPSEISDPARMRPWIAALFPGAPVADDIPDEKAVALFLDGVAPAPGSVLLPPRLTAEVAHVHPDGSLHLALSAPDQRELLAQGWGERHPLHSPQVNVVMLYAPRTTQELDVARAVLRAAYRYARGDATAG